MSNKKAIEYEIKIDGYDSIKGTIKATVNESMTSIREKIEREAGFRENTTYIQQPNISFINDSTKIVVLREMKQKEKERNRKLSQQGSSIVFEEESIIQRSNSQEYMYQQPEFPHRVIGGVKKNYKIFSCMSSNRILILSFSNFRICYNENDVESIFQVKEIKEVSSYKKKSFYFLRLILANNDRLDFKFLNKYTCKKWIQHFHKMVEYSEFLAEKKNYCKAEAYEKFLKDLQKRDEDQSTVIRLNDSEPLESITNEQEVKTQNNTVFKTQSKIVRLADFKINLEIGKGAFSTVYKAERNGKIYALKQLSKDKLIYENQLKYAISELNILKKSKKCPFIIPMYYAFQTEDYLYLALKYLPFGTLKSVIDSRKQLTVKQAVGIICELIVAIEFLHKNNILYRDMKPENIMMTRQGHIYLIDFGLSIQLSEEQQFAESFVGTPLYLAPQRLDGSGKINYKADIYGVGCIFYQLLHGHAPFQGQSLASIIFNIKNSDLILRKDLDDLVQDFLIKTLEKSTDKRLNHMSTHPLFEKVDWKKIEKRQSQVMSIDSKDSGAFTSITGLIDRDYSEENYPNKKVNDWNYFDSTQQKRTQ